MYMDVFLNIWKKYVKNIYHVFEACFQKIPHFVEFSFFVVTQKNGKKNFLANDEFNRNRQESTLESLVVMRRLFIS